jgi:hypothetical protein
VIEYPNVPGPERRRIMAGLKTDYRFYLCTLTFPDDCQDVVACMIEFGKPLGEANFNYLRETHPDHSVHCFWFKPLGRRRWPFKSSSKTTWGWTLMALWLTRATGRWVQRDMRQFVDVRPRAVIV